MTDNGKETVRYCGCPVENSRDGFWLVLAGLFSQKDGEKFTENANVGGEKCFQSPRRDNNCTLMDRSGDKGTGNLEIQNQQEKEPL